MKESIQINIIQNIIDEHCASNTNKILNQTFGSFEGYSSVK